MSVRLLAALQGDLSKMMEQELTSARMAVTTGVREATQGLKSELRSQIEGSGLGSRLANTWRGEVYPKGRPSLGSAGLVYSRAPVVVAAHDQGALIRSKNGFWLAIPLPAAGNGPRGKRMTPLGAHAWSTTALCLSLWNTVTAGGGQLSSQNRQTRRLCGGICLCSEIRTGAHHSPHFFAGAASPTQEEIRHRQCRSTVARPADGVGHAVVARRTLGQMK